MILTVFLKDKFYHACFASKAVNFSANCCGIFQAIRIDPELRQFAAATICHIVLSEYSHRI